MIDLADGFHFAVETGHGLRIMESVSRQQFHGDNALEHAMPGLVDGAHAALAELGCKRVRPESASVLRVGCVGWRQGAGRWGGVHGAVWCERTACAGAPLRQVRVEATGYGLVPNTRRGVGMRVSAAAIPPGILERCSGTQGSGK